MLHRFGLRAALGAAGMALMVGAAPAPALASARPGAAPVGGGQLGSKAVVVSYPSRKVPRLPKVNASAFVIADARTGQVLAAKDPHGWFRPASTLKMLTAVTLIPVLNPAATVVATKQEANVTPNVVGLLPGHPYRISDLFTALLTISANDAAMALATATGSLSQGMTMINAEAHQLQADDTAAKDPNGLDAPGQHTSAYDLALIARRALTLPSFLKYDQTITARFVVSKKKTETLYNQNSLLTSYKGAIGGKIGWTSAAGATYVGMARRNGVTLIVTLLHCPALTEVDAAKSLLNWGFSVDGKVKPVGTLVRALPGPVTAQPSASATSSSPAPSASSSSAPSGGLVGPGGLGGSGGLGRSGTGHSGTGRSGAGEQAFGTRHRAGSGGASALAATVFSVLVMIAVAVGLAYSRRQRVVASYSRQQAPRTRAPADRSRAPT
jgi:serine-type D-Ala-D-Ala carboxypeptidase (penicillin-binding protein 5/6)